MLSITQVLREADLHSETEQCCPIESKSGALSMDYNKRLGEVLWWSFRRNAPQMTVECSPQKV